MSTFGFRSVKIQISVLLTCFLFGAAFVNAGENERYRHSPCKILFSEIQMKGGGSDFIELAKYCPTPGRRTPFLGLDGYYILIASGSTQLTVDFSVNLDGKQLEATTSAVEGSNSMAVNKRKGRKRPGQQVVDQPSGETDHDEAHEFDGRTSFADSVSDDRSLDAAEVPPERLPRSVTALLSLNQTIDTLEITNTSFFPRQKRSNPSDKYNPVNFFMERIPSLRVKSGEVTLVILLHFKQSGRKDKNVEHFLKGQQLSPKDISSIKNKLKDLVLLGHSVPTDLKEKIKSIKEDVFENPINSISVNLDEHDFSINKCDQSSGIFNTITSQYCSPTPAKINACKVVDTQRTENHPFEFGGKSIKTHGQQLVVNVLWALKNNRIGDISIKPLQAASLLLNLNEKTVKRFQNKYETNTIGTPAKKRKLPKPVRDTIDDVKEQMIYDILVSHYKRNEVPKIDTVRETFIQKVRSSQLSTSQPPEKLFTCGLRTFRKILHDLGYKFGKINNRDAVLFDPRIVAWRGKYLKAIRENDAKDPAVKMPVIFTDETWFDIFSRQAYGWVRKCPKTVQEKKDFTFAKHKVARGPRIIIMHAGGENGFVEGMGEVYAVSKKDAAGDYHENVNHQSYLKWFNKLLTTLEGKGPHIIVIDNAPYHSVSTAPPLNSRKQVLSDWLTEQKSAGKDVPELTSLRKFELEDIVRKLKSEEPYYRIDDLAREKGHKVLRTPPYNCQLNPIELVWSDVKRTLREQNTDQNLQLNLLRAKTILQSYDKDLWKRHVNHVKKLEQDYWDGDLEFENTMDRNPDMEIAAIEDDENELSDSDGEDENENVNETSELPGPSKKPKKI